MLAERVARFVRRPEPEAFEALAREAFAFQYERVAPFRELCDRRGATPATAASWREVPTVPTLAFKSLDLAAAPAVEVFRSSGTTGERRSVHSQPFPDLYRAVIDATLPEAFLAGLERPPMLSLVPARAVLPDSSLAFLADHAIARFGAADSATVFGPRGLDSKAARSWLAARQRDRRPAAILATALALASLLEALERLDLRFRLPAGSRVFETGGFKGKRREIGRAELGARIRERLAVPPGRVVREYGMTELTSHFYTRALAGGDPDLFVPPPWTRVRVLDPATLEETRPGAVGLLAVFDLANLGSAVHVLTEDLATAEGGGFRLAGRAAGAELRGCSLAAEELIA